MKKTVLSSLLVFSYLAAAGCGYRFVDPFPASDYALVRVGNATSEAGLAGILEEEMWKVGGFRKSSGNRLSLTVTGFSEKVDSVSASGVPVRQLLTMEVSWKVEGKTQGQATFGREKVTRSYPYSSDPVILEWNRSAAIRLLSESAARALVERLGTGP